MFKTNMTEAQKHVDCLQEAWSEHEGIDDVPPAGAERKRVIQAEIDCRIHAIQILLRHSCPSSNLSAEDAAYVREADAFNGPAEDAESADERMGMN